MYLIILENKNNHNKKIKLLTMLQSRIETHVLMINFKTLTIQTFSILSTKEGAQLSARVISMIKILNIYSHK